MTVPIDPTKDWLRFGVLAVAGTVFAVGLFSLYTAATQWTSLPSNPAVILYFAVVLLVLPLLALWAFVLAWRNERLALASILAGVPAVVTLLRMVLLGGL